MELLRRLRSEERDIILPPCNGLGSSIFHYILLFVWVFLFFSFFDLPIRLSMSSLMLGFVLLQ